MLIGGHTCVGRGESYRYQLFNPARIFGADSQSRRVGWDCGIAVLNSVRNAPLLGRLECHPLVLEMNPGLFSWRILLVTMAKLTDVRAALIEDAGLLEPARWGWRIFTLAELARPALNSTGLSFSVTID